MKYKLPKPDGKYGHTRKQVLKICRDLKIHHKKFWKAFGVNTCALDGKEINYYTCDIERTLWSLNKPGGNFHIWD